MKQRRYQTDQMVGRRRAWIEANGPCRRCGSWKQLEVDHVDPKQKKSHRIWSWSPHRRAAELQKCQVLCRTCHEAKSAHESSMALRQPVPHGTHSGYSRHGCRCEPCRVAHREYDRAWRAARGAKRASR